MEDIIQQLKNRRTSHEIKLAELSVNLSRIPLPGRYDSIYYTQYIKINSIIGKLTNSINIIESYLKDYTEYLRNN